LRIVGGTPGGADIDTYDDHRIAMSFAIAGLKTKGVRIADPRCVAKSFPNYWEVFDQLYQ
jgi:3-phosphoshikimate 1-carboxyvinyltransferase